MGSFTDAVAVSKIFINTNLAACGGVMAAAILTRLMLGKTDVLQMLNGAIGGLGGSSGGGGGASGYTDGSVEIVATQLGGSTGDAKCILRVVT